MALPSAAELYQAYFKPWYPEESTPRAYTGIRPDMEEIMLPEGTHINVLHPLPVAAREAPAQQVTNMRTAAEQDWPRLLGVALPIRETWLDAFDRHFTESRIEELLKGCNPEQFSNTYLILCCELGAVLGDVLKQRRPGLQWIHDWPYWDSALFDLNSRTRINVFHWAVKKLSVEGAGHRLGEKMQACLAFMGANA